MSSPRIVHPAKRAEVLEERRNLKMARSVHAFVRGSTTKFYEWLEAAARHIPDGPPVWICGDCHSGNLGPLSDSNGRVEIAIRDLDHTIMLDEKRPAPGNALTSGGLIMHARFRLPLGCGLVCCALLCTLKARAEAVTRSLSITNESQKPATFQVSFDGTKFTNLSEGVPAGKTVSYVLTTDSTQREIFIRRRPTRGDLQHEPIRVPYSQGQKDSTGQTVDYFLKYTGR